MTTFEKCKKELEPLRERHDDEAFHGRFDELLEQRLDELDPDFMQQMRVYYEKSEMCRWCA